MRQSGGSLLHVATLQQSEEAILLLLRMGSDPDVTDNIGQTPLHYAASLLFAQGMFLLLDYGANPRRVDLVSCTYTRMHANVTIYNNITRFV